MGTVYMQHIKLTVYKPYAWHHKDNGKRYQNDVIYFL